MLNIKSISATSILFIAIILASFILPASPAYAKETQAGSFGMEENAINMKIVLEAEGKNAVIRSKTINGKTYYRVFITDEPAATADAPAIEEPANEMPESDAPAEPMEQEPRTPEPPAEAPEVETQSAKYIYIDGLGTIYSVEFRSVSRLYPQPSFKRHYTSMYAEIGAVNVIGKTENGWLVVRAKSGGDNLFMPADDWKLVPIGKKKRLSAPE